MYSMSENHARGDKSLVLQDCECQNVKIMNDNK